MYVLLASCPYSVISSHVNTSYSLKPLSIYIFQEGTCVTSDLLFSPTDAGVTIRYPDESVCSHNSVTIPNLAPELYQAKQMQLYMASEHTIDGTQFVGELQIVHKAVADDADADSTDKYAVMSLMIDATATTDNIMFDSLLAQWAFFAEKAAAVCENVFQLPSNLNTGAATASARQAGDMFNIYDLFEQGDHMYQYDAGITAQPCTDSVSWNVAETALAISAVQFSQLTFLQASFRSLASCLEGLATDNVDATAVPAARVPSELVPLNGRTVATVCPSSEFVPDSDEPEMVVDPAPEEPEDDGEDEPLDKDLGDSAASVVVSTTLWSLGMATAVGAFMLL